MITRKAAALLMAITAGALGSGCAHQSLDTLRAEGDRTTIEVSAQRAELVSCVVPILKEQVSAWIGGEIFVDDQGDRTVVFRGGEMIGSAYHYWMSFDDVGDTTKVLLIDGRHDLTEDVLSALRQCAEITVT